MAAPRTHGAGLLALILEADPGHAGEILRTLTFVGPGDGRTPASEVRADARPWPETEAVEFRREHRAEHPDVVMLDPGATRGYTFPLGPLTVDVLWFPADGDLHYVISRAGAPLRRLRTREAGGDWLEPETRPSEAPVRRRPGSRLAGLRPAAVVRGAATLAERFEQEPYWQAEAVIAGSIWLVLGLTKKLTVGPVWLMPATELLLLAALFYTDPRRRIVAGLPPRTRLWPRLTLALVGLVNTASLALLVHELLNNTVKGAPGHALILAAVVIWVTNVVIFALAFWELDRGGPDLRADPATEGAPSFLFPQMTAGGDLAARFRPTFFDYLYTSTTNATAFSPTDTMPLGSPAKALMMVQALASLVTVGLVAARAVNILL
jgi:hypothetical protein